MRAAALALALLLGSSAVLSSAAPLQSDLDRIFADPLLDRALMAVRVEALRDGRLLYALNDQKLVMPGSNMKIVTLAVTGARLGWAFQYETRLEATGQVVDGTLRGDLIVTGTGDPSIGLPDEAVPAPLFAEWARALAQTGIRRVQGRLIGDDDVFDDEGLGLTWSLDDIGAGYAAPTGALSYNENAVTLRMRPGRAAGERVLLELAPPGHELIVTNEVSTDAPTGSTDLQLLRRPGQPYLTIRGTVPAGAAALTRTASVDNPTRFFTEGLRMVLAEHGIPIEGGAWDIDDVGESAPVPERRVLAQHMSEPLSILASRFAKESQNFYGETFVKTLGRHVAGEGTTAAGLAVVTETLSGWGLPSGELVIVDGSGLSRNNYLTAGALVEILERMWRDEAHREPFTAALPVAGRDGTLERRMRDTVLESRVEAKTGTISNVRALSGYLETRSGERLVFSMVANHFTAPSRDIDAIVERALARLAAE